MDVVPNEKVEYHFMMEEGEITCSRLRTCEYIKWIRKEKSMFLCVIIILFTYGIHLTDVIRFDNTCSFFRSKNSLVPNQCE